MRAIVAVLDKRRLNAVKAAITMLEALRHRSADSFGLASPINVEIKKDVGLLRECNLSSPTAIGHVFVKILETDKPQPMWLRSATFVFEGRAYQLNVRVSDAELAAERLKEDRVKGAESIIKRFDGGFAFAIAERGRLIIGRDPLGLCPLYYGENNGLAAVASERKALWGIGVKKAEAFPPGYLAVVNAEGFKFKRIKALTYLKAKPITMRNAVKRLRALLERSMAERASGIGKVAIAFSGGLDSSLTAFLAKNLGVDAYLIHVSLEGQPETGWAEDAAERLNLPLRTFLYRENDVKETLQKVLWAVESSNPVEVSVGIPIFWVAERASEMGFKVMFTGHGMDELFGGYKRYLNDYSRHGEEFVRRAIFNDVTSMHETNFARDSKICRFHNVELRLPLITYKLVKFALSLPLKLKISSKNDPLRKIVLRKAAERIGLLKQIAKRGKRAIQYATGVNKALERLAKGKGLSLREYLMETFQTIYPKRERDT